MVLLFKQIKPFIVSLVVLLTDFFSKKFTTEHIPTMINLWYPYGGLGVFKDWFGIEFSIVHHSNKGAAWGHFAQYQEQLVWLRIGLITGLIIYAFFINKQKQWNIPMAFIIGGAIGNVVDYYMYGHVVDMIHFVFWGYDYPVFNIADSAIFIGVCWMVTLSLLNKNQTAFVKK